MSDAQFKRYCRAIASDLSLYEQAKITEGLENDTFFEIIKDQIEEGRATIRGKFGEDLLNNTNLFECALIDGMIATRTATKSPIF